MRAVSITILYLLIFQTLASQYKVFVKDGFYGIMDQEGNVAVPAVYDQLGWSDNSQAIVDQVIGFKENGYWGVVSTKNKVVAEPKYYSITPFDHALFKVSIKGRFSNQLFYGLINASGKTEVSTNYFSIEALDAYLLVSDYEQRQKFGVVDFSDKRIVPLKYEHIQLKGDLFHGYQFNSKLDLYKPSGQLLCEGLDSLRTLSTGIVGFRQGYAGFINNAGVVLESFQHKDIEVSGNDISTIPFPKWEIYLNDELLFGLQADSLDYSGDEFWNAYINGTHHLVSPDSSYQFPDSYLKAVTENHYLLQNARTGKWSALTKQHEAVLQEYDSIYLSKYAMWGNKDGNWQLHNRYGQKRNRFTYQSVKIGVDGQFIVKLKGHWGIMDPLGTQVTPIKYDAIELDQGFYKVDYLGRKGIMDPSGSWKVRAENSNVMIFSDLLVAQKGFSFSYFGKDGLLAKTTLAPIRPVGNGLLVKEEGLVGLVDFDGELVLEPRFKEINWKGGFYELKRDSSMELADSLGRVVFNETLQLQSYNGQTEELFLVKKRDRWGFLDSNARLRIGNRYDSARLFSEGFAPVMVRNRWGFIDKSEALVVQPYYDEVTHFEVGLSIVKAKDLYGLIDTSGNEIVKVKWQEIEKMDKN